MTAQTNLPSEIAGRAGFNTNQRGPQKGAECGGESPRNRAPVLEASEAIRSFAHVEVVGPADWPADTSALLLERRMVRQARERDLHMAFARMPDDPGPDASTMDDEPRAWAVWGALACLMCAVAVVSTLVAVLLPMVAR